MLGVGRRGGPSKAGPRDESGFESRFAAVRTGCLLFAASVRKASEIPVPYDAAILHTDGSGIVLPTLRSRFVALASRPEHIVAGASGNVCRIINPSTLLLILFLLAAG
jgi:hypothetical protein